MVMVMVWEKGEVAKVVARRWPSGPAFPMPSICGAERGPGFSHDWWKVRARGRLNWRRSLPCATGHDISSSVQRALSHSQPGISVRDTPTPTLFIQVEEELCAEG